MARLFNSRTVAIAISITAILLISFLVFSLVRARESQYRNTSNISRKQYDAALAKWNNLHVTDYEATAQSSYQGKWKIIVHVDPSYGKAYDPSAQLSYSHRIVNFESLDSKSANMDAHFYQFVTVGGLFDRVDDILTCQENTCGGDFFVPNNYVVEFDQTMGYPRSITNTDPHATYETTLEIVRILK
jgi:hypothetical protein